MLKTQLALFSAVLAFSPALAGNDQASPANADQHRGHVDAAAPSAEQDIPTVTAPTLADWSTRISRSLSGNMRFPSLYFGELVPEGVAQVYFTCSDSGAPDNIRIAKSSGDRRLDREALSAVRRIKTMHPLASGIAPDQLYAAHLVFARSEESLRTQMRSLDREMAMRRDGPSDGVIALVAVPGMGAR